MGKVSFKVLVKSLNFLFKKVSQLVRRGQFLAVGTFFRVFAGQLEGTVSPPFCLF